MTPTLKQPTCRLRKFREVQTFKKCKGTPRTEYITSNQQLGKLQKHRVVIVQNDGETQFIAEKWANKPLTIARSKTHPELFVLHSDTA